MDKQKKFLLMAPLLVLPFLTMAFWALGGGKGKSETQVVTVKGFDTSLPQAQFKKEKPEDKMDVYQRAKKDSVSTTSGISREFSRIMGFAPHRDQSSASPTAEESTARIQAKLAAINKHLRQSEPVYHAPDAPAPDPEVKRLNTMMHRMNRPQKDPEMQQLNNMLTKIQAIQNPGSVRSAVQKSTDSKPFRAIPAIIDGKQKVKDGGAVKLKLTDTVTLKRQLLPKGQEIFGVCQVANQRLLLNIQNIRLGKQIIPVNLTVFSLDGMPGIPAPKAELGSAASNGADNAVQSMQFLTMDQSIGAQAAAGGVNAAKGLFSKKIKKIKVKLKDEYPVLLKINP
jgi:hypothetical protein